ncbi:MAG TPA: hypothetical protein PLH15_10645 [Spirochaetota bacterium]|nr:hypothetical protein [Spirochaetota bacterium]HQQ24286.1 hypothetical protein [Spirochaetota bacterium]
MQKLKPILHEINNADQIVSEIREQLETGKESDFEKIVEMQESLERAIKLFNIANGKISDAIIKDLEETHAALEKLSEEA